jgi:transposase
LRARWWRRRLIWLDGGYKESLFEWVKTIKRWREVRLEQVKRSDRQKGFAVLAKRWVVERTCGWLVKHRRLSKDYEAWCETSESMVYVAMIRLMLARLDA